MTREYATEIGADGCTPPMPHRGGLRDGASEGLVVTLC